MRLVIDPKHRGAPWVDELLAKVMARPPEREFTKQQRSLLRLSMTAAQLHARCLAGGIEPPRTKDGRSQPLQLMKTCLATLEKGMRQ
jgi:hypothetical protein